MPDVQIIVLLVMATKLIFPFDDIARHPATNNEPATQAMDWQKWMQAQRQFESQKHPDGKLGKEKIIQMTESDVFNMDPSQLDEYMDWYEKSWLAHPSDTTPIMELFPISRPETKDTSASRSNPNDTSNAEDDEEAALTTMLQTVMESIVAVPPVPREEGKRPTRPGVWYHRYRWESTLPETARLFYEIAAQLAGVSLQTLVRAVKVAEWRVAHWQDNQRRADYEEFGEEFQDEDEDMYGNFEEEDMDQLYGDLADLDVE